MCAWPGFAGVRRALSIEMTPSRVSVCPPLAILIFLAASPIQWAEARPSAQLISLEDYVSELDRCSAAIANAGNDPSELRTARLSVPERWVVHSRGQTYVVNADWLATDLAKAETALHRNRSVLQEAQQDISVRRDAAQALAEADPARNLDSFKAKLGSILAAKEFQTTRGPTWLESLRARLYDWIVRQFEKLYTRLPHGRTVGNVIAWTVIALSSLVLLFWLVRAASRGGARPEMGLRGASKSRQDSAYWLRQARSLAARGDYRKAIHAAYWGGIARLEEAKVLTEDRSRTPRESLRLIQESAEHAALSQLTRRFELVWYGYRPAGSADWNEAVRQLETLGCLGSSTPAISAS
jgi:hypothetical protein